MYHDGEAHLGGSAVSTNGVHGELQVALVAQVVAAGGHHTGEVAVEALSREVLRQALGHELSSLRGTDQRDGGAGVVVDNLHRSTKGTVVPTVGAERCLEVLAGRSRAQNCKDASRQAAHDRLSLGVTVGRLQVHLLHGRHGFIVGSVREREGLHQRIKVDGRVGGGRVDLVHYRTGGNGSSRTIGGLAVGVVVLGAVGSNSPPRAVDDAALLLDVAWLLTAVALHMRENGAVEAGNRVASTSRWGLTVLAPGASVATLALAVLAFAILGLAANALSLSIASAFALLRYVDTKFLQLSYCVSVARLRADLELGGAEADLVVIEGCVSGATQQLRTGDRMVLDGGLVVRR